jgi:hypothetical protein
MLRYLARVAEDITPESVETLVDEHFPEKEGGKIMATLAEQWEERGLQKGIQKGKTEGACESLQNAIQDGLEAKFGSEGLAVMPRIREIKDSGRLRQILKMAWTASSLKEFQDHIQDS